MHIEKYFRYVPLAKCPYCGVKSELKLKGGISLAGWVMAITLFFLLGWIPILLPIAFIPLTMKDYHYSCSKCGMKLTF
jgi:hypothetical protein